MHRSFQILLASLSVCCWAFSVTAQALNYHAENVLGTSLDVSVFTTDIESNADDAFQGLLLELQSLEAILSNYRADSEINLLNTDRKLSDPSKVLLTVLDKCQYWAEQSKRRFSCRLGAIRDYWNDKEQKQLAPNRIKVRALARRAQEAKIRRNVSGLSLGDGLNLDVSGLAKGFIIDQAVQYLRDNLSGVQAIKVDIGGDAFYWGHPPDQDAWQVGITNPFSAVDNAEPLAILNLDSMALAASGNVNRAHQIVRKRYGHIYDTHDGWPLRNAPSAFVVASDASMADAIATTLCTQSPAQGLVWINQMQGVEALVIAADGAQFPSKNWYDIANSVPSDTKVATKLGKKVLRMEYTIPAFTSSDYNRPYVSVWISDAKGKLVRTLLQLGESERWARENTRWWRRIGRRNPDLLQGVALPTRKPGVYRLEWDGRDRSGKEVQSTDYRLHIEAAREHGGHDHQVITLSYPFENTDIILEAKGEIGALKVSSKKPSSRRVSGKELGGE